MKKGEKPAHTDYMDNFSPSIQKNPMLLEISPLSYGQFSNENANQNQRPRINGVIGSQAYIDGNSARKIDFYPSQEIDSIDIQVTNQQKSYDASEIMTSNPNILNNLSKPTEESKLITSLGDQPHKAVTSQSSSFGDSEEIEDEELYEDYS